jgi:bifunctional non-homologous end joining protein LigD
MHPASVREPFVDDDWVFEIKWDGVRSLLFYDGETTRLVSRSGKDITDRYPELASFDAEVPVVLDGEIVALDENARPSFERLQQRMNLSSPSAIAETMKTVPVNFAAFDVLYADGDITRSSFDDRRVVLEELDLAAPFVTSEVVESDPTALWEFVRHRGLEGIVAKRRDSAYRPGARSPDWRKITVARRVRAIVGGFTEGDGGRSGSFGALLLGLWTETGLRWIGSVGSGFDDWSLGAIREALDQMRMDNSPFLPGDDLPRKAVWVYPQLVALVEFREWTQVGRLRGPVFKGFTDDPHGEVTWEAEGPQSDDT